MDKEKKIKIMVLIGVPVILVILFIFRDPIMWVGSMLGKCWFHEITGYHCPGCGNTRAVKALLHFQLITALRNNPTIPVLSVLGILYYIEIGLDVAGKKIKLVPRSLWFWLGLLSVLTIYLILRNFIPVLAPIPPEAVS